MIRAYDETYLDDAMNNLGDMFDYAVNDCNYDPDEFYSWFIISGVAAAFERGNPKYLAGLSGPELASEVIYRTERIRLDIPPSENTDKSAEYWAGWSLAYYQWQTTIRFSDMQKCGLTITRILALYPTLHEADLTKFVNIANDIMKTNREAHISNLQRIRKTAGITQKRLAEASGVTLRMIQLYEQRRQDINRAQAASIVRMSHVLGCDTEDLLENE